MSGNRELLEALVRFPKKDIFDCVPLIYLVLKMSGMGCITPRFGIRNGTTMTTVLDVVLFVVNLVLAVSLMVYGTFFAERQLQSPIMYIGLKMVNFTCYASTIYGLISCFINRHDIWKFYNEAYVIDTMLAKLGERTNFNRSFTLFVMYYGAAMGTCLFMIIILYRRTMSWLLLLNLIYTYFSLTTFHIVSVTCLEVVWVRNLRLNRALRRQLSLADNVVEAPTLITSGPNQKLVLRQIMQIFDLVCDLADEGSFYYGIQV
ncbi:AGAP001114-PA-like protein [Anopheles sinensis]|uniref:AGAP001114-PA-like protein n=1 Tax=Anopheles sinensis TaxID=74873 RepID=A0A084W088_ANOSI|nr:AGAP001114-PA-like protein [Anopheles sinensis]